MKVEVDLTEYGVKAPKWYDPINPHVINASGGSGGGNDVELTWEEYEALSEEEKMSGTNYFITDIGNPKSLVTKTLIDTPLQSTETIYNLSDSYKNYDYVIVFITGSDSTYIRAASNVVYTNTFSGGSIDYTTWTTDTGRIDKWRASTSFRFASDTTIRIYDIMQDSSAYEGGPFTPTQSRLRVIGYRYERVIVPNQMVNYSTVEQRIGTWIDGKPLYRKTFELSSRVIIGNNFYTVISDITEFNIDKIVASVGYDNGGTSDMYNSCCPAITFAKSGSALLAYGGTMAYGVTAFTLQYTKTTD